MSPSQHISKYFTYGETVVTAHRRIDNTPPLRLMDSIKQTADQMDRIREFLGGPIIVSSWYRCVALNAAVGSKTTSAHPLGLAVDFIAPSVGTVPKLVTAIAQSGIEFDQLIEENPQSASGGWVHLSFDPKMRGQILTFNGARYVLRNVLPKAA
jgi:hypothetical protein